MRTTLNIDDDVLYAIKGLAQQEGRSVGKVLSNLARQALCASAVSVGSAGEALGERLASLGLTPYCAPGVQVVKEAQINDLREAEGD